MSFRVQRRRSLLARASARPPKPLAEARRLGDAGGPPASADRFPDGVYTPIAFTPTEAIMRPVPIAGVRTASCAGRLVDRRRPLGGLRSCLDRPADASPRRGHQRSHGGRDDDFLDVAQRFGTAATDVAGFGSRGGTGRLPGWLFIPHTIHMGLDNYPVRCECGQHSYKDDIPKGFTHRKTEPCPFKNDDFPIGMMGSCCWLRGKVAAHELEALGEDDLSGRMLEDMTAEEALAFADELVAVATRLEAQYAGLSVKPRGTGWNGRWNDERKEWVWGKYSTFEEALASIREAARWYEKVGRLGYGVHAWY